MIRILIRKFLAIAIIFTIIISPFGVFAQVPSPTANDDDIIKQLKQESKKQEEALKIDLESLGLDPLPEVEKVVSPTVIPTPPAPAPELPTPPKVEPKKEEVKKAPPVKIDPRLMGISAQTTEQEKQEAEAKLPAPLPPTEQKTAGDADKKTIQNIISNPINRIRTLFDSDKKPAADQSSKDLDQKEEKSGESSEDQEKAKKEAIRKEAQRQEKIRQQKIAMQEIIQKQKAAKLESLRQQYLLEASEDEAFEGTDYKTISKIVPKAKIPPKFLITEEIPPPLLNRIRGEENKHHPMIMSNSERVDFMFKAIAGNRIDEFNSLYSELKDPNLRNTSGDTLLTFAILMQRHDAVVSILSKGANPDMKNNLGYTPMNIAIEIMDYKSAKTLAEMGANINYIDGVGRTYLMQAARAGSLPIVDLLIRNGIDVNATDDNGVTALGFAYQYKRDVVAKYLLKFDAKDSVKKNIYLPSRDMQMINDIFEKWR